MCCSVLISAREETCYGMDETALFNRLVHGRIFQSWRVMFIKHELKQTTLQQSARSLGCSLLRIWVVGLGFVDGYSFCRHLGLEYYLETRPSESG